MKDPKGYAEFMVSLYQAGSSIYGSKLYTSSPEMREAGVTLEYDGLTNNKAD